MTLELSPDSRCARLGADLSTDVGTVLGNLVDNALDAVANSAEATVTVEIVSDAAQVRIVVVGQRARGPGERRRSGVRPRVLDQVLRPWPAAAASACRWSG